MRLKTFDFAKAVIDDEIAQMMKRVKRGINFSDDELALDLIKEHWPRRLIHCRQAHHQTHEDRSRDDQTGRP